MSSDRSVLTNDDFVAVSPALAELTKDTVAGELWNRPQLSARDRAIVTVSALIARSQSIGMLHYFNKGLDSGVTACELSEIVTHLAFYSGWSSAFSAVPFLKQVFAQRGIEEAQLPEVSPTLLPLNEVAETQRASTVQQNFGDVAPGVVQYTTDLLFRSLWLRPALAPRDRSLVTVSALIASGQVLQITYHLNRAMDTGLHRNLPAEARLLLPVRVPALPVRLYQTRGRTIRATTGVGALGRARLHPHLKVLLGSPKRQDRLQHRDNPAAGHIPAVHAAELSGVLGRSALATC